MTKIDVQKIKHDLRITHDSDDALLADHLSGAEDEALRFMGRLRLPEVDDQGCVIPDDDPRVGAIAPSIYPAICLLVRAKYEAVDGAEIQALRRAAESLLMPYRRGLGV